jgi:hypothetical protein
MKSFRIAMAVCAVTLVSFLVSCKKEEKPSAAGLTEAVNQAAEDAKPAAEQAKADAAKAADDAAKAVQDVTK